MSGRQLRKIAILASVLALIGLFWFFDFGHYLTLDYIKESQARFSELYEAHRFLVIGGYMAVYILVTALSLPGAVIMTLAGGGMFGLTVGTVVISFASTIGATLACLVARTLLRDWVERRFGDRLSAINEGIGREGGFYLFTLRLVPLFPFFVINLVMGLTAMRLSTFFWVSQLGMLPGTLVYVNAGRELAKIDSVSGILSPTFLVSFAILGLFPLIAKKLLPILRQRFDKSRHSA